MHTSRNKYITWQTGSDISTHPYPRCHSQVLLGCFHINSIWRGICWWIWVSPILLVSYLICAGDNVVPDQYGETRDPDILSHRIPMSATGNNRLGGKMYNRLAPKTVGINYAKMYNGQARLTFQSLRWPGAFHSLLILSPWVSANSAVKTKQVSKVCDSEFREDLKIIKHERLSEWNCGGWGKRLQGWTHLYTTALDGIVTAPDQSPSHH